MSHYYYWHLLNEDDVEVFNYDGLQEYLKTTSEREGPNQYLPNLVRMYQSEKVIEETTSRRVTQKFYSFMGLYPPEKENSDGYWENGNYGINHGDPGPEMLSFIGDLSHYMGPLTFLVFDEKWPGLDPGLVTLVRAEKGKVLYAKDMLLVEEENNGRRTRKTA